MIALGRRAAGGRWIRLANAVAAGTLAGVFGSTITSCSSDKSQSVVARDIVEKAAAAPVENVAARTMRADCLSCHATAHKAVLGRGPAALVRCEECHANVHATYKTVEALYAGNTRDSAVHPDAMYAAHVKCVECHTDATLAKAGAARAAELDAACTSCHGPKFGGMAARWVAGVDWRTHAVSSFVNQASTDPRLAGSATRARIQSARQAVSFVSAGGGVHNLRGADALLRGAIDTVSAAYQAAGLAAPAPPALGPDPASVSCVGCHYGIEAVRDSVFGMRFDHGAHVVSAGVACTKCHSGIDYLVPDKRDSTKQLVDRRHGKTFVSAASCENCHHAPTTKAACSQCHAGEARLGRTIAVTMPLKLTQRGAPTSRTVAFDHRLHGKVDCATCHASRPDVRNVASCSNCHQNHHEQATQCSACHGTTAHDAHKAADHLNCTACHARQTVALLTPNRAFCATCHADRANHKPGRECSSCHMQSTPAELKKKILSGAGTH